MGSLFTLSRDLLPHLSDDNLNKDSESVCLDLGYLTNLPTELLAMIIRHLPPSFFQKDIGRLALSKRWYKIAQPLLYPRMEFTPRILDRLADDGSFALDMSFAPLYNTLRCANIVLDGADPDLMRLDTPRNLFFFTMVLQGHTEIKALRLATRWDNRESDADPRLQEGYLDVYSIGSLLTMPHLTSLDLDLCGTDVKCVCGTRHHFCGFARNQLSQLQTLRLRMRSICHEAIWPIEGSAVTLRELTLNLYLGNVSDRDPKLNSSWRCGDRDPTAPWESPMDELRARMRALVKVMKDPRRGEIEHLAPSGEVHIWDATTGVCVRDETEKIRQFPLCSQAQCQRPCFHKNADDWVWDAELGVGGIPTSDDHPGEVEGLDEDNEPNGTGEEEDAVMED